MVIVFVHTYVGVVTYIWKCSNLVFFIELSEFQLSTIVLPYVIQSYTCTCTCVTLLLMVLVLWMWL